MTIWHGRSTLPCLRTERRERVVVGEAENKDGVVANRPPVVARRVRATSVRRKRAVRRSGHGSHETRPLPVSGEVGQRTTSAKERCVTKNLTSPAQTLTSKKVKVSYGRTGSISREVIRRQRTTQTGVAIAACTDDLFPANAA
jgi:hypothetical protein